MMASRVTSKYALLIWFHVASCAEFSIIHTLSYETECESELRVVGGSWYYNMCVSKTLLHAVDYPIYFAFCSQIR